jgi:hypothetical protein
VKELPSVTTLRISGSWSVGTVHVGLMRYDYQLSH